MPTSDGKSKEVLREWAEGAQICVTMHDKQTYELMDGQAQTIEDEQPPVGG